MGLINVAILGVRRVNKKPGLQGKQKHSAINNCNTRRKPLEKIADFFLFFAYSVGIHCLLGQHRLRVRVKSRGLFQGRGKNPNWANFFARNLHFSNQIMNVNSRFFQIMVPDSLG